MMINMRAIPLTQTGGPEVLTIQEAPIPCPSNSDVLVKVHATALNRADLLQRKGKYPLPADTTPIPGLELAGEVVAIGKNVTQFAVGNRVCGLVNGGAYADYALLDEHMAIPIPDSLSFIEAAAIPEAFLTAQEAVFTLGKLGKDQSILIHAGASGVGSAAIQLARLVTDNIYFTASTNEKITAMLRMGALQGINYKTQDFFNILHDAQGLTLDVIVDFVGGDYFAKHIQLLKRGGHLTQVAFMNGKQANLNLHQLVFKQLHINGLIMRMRPLAQKREITRRFITELLPKFAAKKLKPIIDSEFNFTAMPDAHRRMEANLNIGKIVINMNHNTHAMP